MYKLSSRKLPKHTPDVSSRTHQNEANPNELVFDESGDQLLDPYSNVTHDKCTIQNQYLYNLAPPPKRAYNFAAFINHSDTLKELVKLGVSLYDIENTNQAAAERLLKLDFMNDCMPYINLLLKNGLKATNIGRFISEYPDLFSQPMDRLEEVIRYLKFQGFSKKHIASALNRSSQILRYDVKRIDYKLGEFQIEFKMRPKDVIRIVSIYPELISLPKEQYRVIKFVVTEEFGFKMNEIHEILINQPKILGLTRFALIERLELIHNVIGLDHSTIVKIPKLITGPKLDITHRHEYLKKLNRNQYDPSKPLYVPPFALYNCSDLEFCQRYSKTSLDDYRSFLKSC